MNNLKKVLVIEDEAPFRKRITRILALEGFQTLEASNGREGVKIALSNLPDVIISDITMPEMDGYEVCKHLRSDPSTALIPFIFLTALSNKTEIRQGMRLGADDYLIKPFDLQELITAVTTRLERNQQFTRRIDDQVEVFRSYVSTTIPHEFRTPLTSIMGFAELLHSEYDTIDPEQAREMLNYIIKGGKNLSRLVENFLLHSWLFSDGPETRAVEEAPPQASSELIREVAVKIAESHERGDDVSVKVEPAVLCLGESHLRKIIEELMDNACRFSEKNSAITLTAGLSDGAYRILISDEGRGMKANDIAAIGPFKQFDRLVYEQQGLGLGLAIVRRLTETNAGSFELESSVGEGTTAKIILCRQEEQ